MSGDVLFPVNHLVIITRFDVRRQLLHSFSILELTAPECFPEIVIISPVHIGWQRISSQLIFVFPPFSSSFG